MKPISIIRIIAALFIGGTFNSKAALSGPVPAETSGVEGKPNVILIVTDDQGYGDLSCYGNPWLKTPEMDKLYDQGVRLTDFHVDPTCAPTRAAIMTGRYSAHTGVWLTYGSRHHLRSDETTMADVFKQNGYTTAIFGKWHLGDNYPFRPSDRGFDESLIHGGGVVGETPDYWDNNYYDDTYFRNNKPEKVTGYCTDVWFNEAKKYIKKNKEKPFFVYLPTNAPHGPLHVPEKYRKEFQENPETKPRAEFYGMIRNIDENLGKLRQFLKTENLDRNTILIFFNDNGTNNGAKLAGPEPKGNRNGWVVEGYNAGMRGIKTSAYEGGHRAACFILWPDGGITGGRDVNGLSAHIDLLPTLVDLCKLHYTPKLPFDGISLSNYLKTPNAELPERTLVVNEQGRFGQPVGDAPLIKYKDFAVMRNHWRLVGDELYDLESDPSQKNDISKEHPEVVQQLKNEYEKWWTIVAERADENCAFVIDPRKQTEVKISSQNLRGDDVVYSQRMVRAGKVANGWTYIDVEKPGKYKITLRRFPKESGLALRDKAKKYPQHPSTHKMIRINDVALDIVSARLKVGNFDKQIPVIKNCDEVVFEVDLPKGEQQIQSWFELKDGSVITAYYMYIQGKL